MAIRPWLALPAVFLANVSFAAPPSLTPTVPNCVPKRANSMVSLTVEPDAGWGSVRTYFRKADSSDFYFLEMRSAGKGIYWAALPRPEDATSTLEVQIAVWDSDGKETTAPIQKIPVTGWCSTTINQEQTRYAQNLVVGETAASQTGLVIAGFLCDGVISRINASGRLKPDEACRRALMERTATAEEHNRGKGIPVLLRDAGGVAIIRNTEKTEASKPRP